MVQLRNEQKEVLDSKSQPIRQYLLDNLVPILTDGLLDICKRQPDDPVDSCRVLIQTEPGCALSRPDHLLKKVFKGVY